jgi:hypothetical protein
MRRNRCCAVKVSAECRATCEGGPVALQQHCWLFCCSSYGKLAQSSCSGKFPKTSTYKLPRRLQMALNTTCNLSLIAITAMMSIEQSI